LQNGQEITLYSEDLEVDGIVQFSTAENLWVAVIDWDNIKEKQDVLLKEDEVVI
jgi:hypothetical protein